MKTILIVDDEPGQLRSLRIGLQGKGYRIIETQNGQTALGMLDNSPGIDMVITDYSMPGMTGMELLKEIKEKSPPIPVIMMTAHGEKSLVIEALRNQCDNFIEKPFSLEELSNEIDKVKSHMKDKGGPKDLAIQLSKIVHQINNPLAAISGQAELGMRYRLNDQEALKKTLESILKFTDKIKVINRQILKIGKSQKEKMERVDIIDIIETALKMFAGLIKLKEVVIEKVFEHENMFVYGSKYSLEQAFKNLTMNAIEAMDGKQKKVLKVEVKSNSHKDSLWVRVADTGCGISEDDIQKIFTPYFTGKQNGNGLGLSVVKDIICNHGGSIEVEPLPTGGTCFIIELPAPEANWGVKAGTLEEGKIEVNTDCA